jgi:hypothetical protein
MPYGMGRAGWFCWPPWAGFRHPGYHGYQYPYWPPVYPISPTDEEAFLAGQAEALQAELQQIEERLKELKKAKEEKKK